MLKFYDHTISYTWSNAPSGVPESLQHVEVPGSRDVPVRRCRPPMTISVTTSACSCGATAFNHQQHGNSDDDCSDGGESQADVGAHHTRGHSVHAHCSCGGSDAFLHDEYWFFAANGLTARSTRHAPPNQSQLALCPPCGGSALPVLPSPHALYHTHASYTRGVVTQFTRAEITHSRTMVSSRMSTAPVRTLPQLRLLLDGDCATIDPRRRTIRRSRAHLHQLIQHAVATTHTRCVHPAWRRTPETSHLRRRRTSPHRQSGKGTIASSTDSEKAELFDSLDFPGSDADGTSASSSNFNVLAVPSLWG